MKTSPYFIFLFVFFICNPIAGQNHFPYSPPPKDSLYRMTRHGKWFSSAETIGLVPEVHGFRHLTIGLNLCRGSFETGEGYFGGKGIQIGIEYLPINQVVAPKVKLWKASFVYGFSGNIGASSLLYYKKDKGSLALRPEIGIGLVYFQINYGYTFFLNKNFEELSPHTFSIMCYHTIFPKNK